MATHQFRLPVSLSPHPLHFPIVPLSLDVIEVFGCAELGEEVVGGLVVGLGPFEGILEF
ncbi:MAG: hypothetical protein SVX43_10340 [Cyanobacteriota bacterium]|nr:hypothetical protein [Cyanobacteriota bacterium]